MVNFVVNEKRSRDKYFRYTFANKLPNNGVLIVRKQGDEREKRKRNSNLRFRVLGVTFNWSFKAFRVKFLVSRPIFSGVCVA